jgi:hypothetical protein
MRSLQFDPPEAAKDFAGGWRGLPTNASQQQFLTVPQPA